MSELLSCPFCGSEYTQARYMGLSCDRGFEQGWRGECCECGALTRAYSTEAEAVAAWNTRAERTCHIEMYPLGLHEEDGEAPICSACRVAIDEDVYYCPNCGAKVVDE